MNINIKSPKIQIILLLATLAGVGVFTGDPAAKLWVLTYGILAAVFTEWMLWGKAKPQMLQSAVITGSIIGMLSSPGTNLMFVWLAAFAAISSKRFIQIQGNHVFNPAALGLFIAGLALSNQVNWWGSSLSPVIIVRAGIILLRLKRLEMTFAYITGRVLFAMLVGVPLSGALMLPNFFFAFIMLIEPKTSPSKRGEQLVFGLGCGALSTIAANLIPQYETDLAALLIMNLLRKPIRMIFNRKTISTERQHEI